jgi:hypothetical protein
MLLMQWKALIEKLAKNNPHAKPNPPATEQQINQAERKLNAKIPDDLKNFWRQLNGDDNLVFSTDQIIETNLSVRELGFYMPLNCLLFFGANGCGDYYGFPITRDDGVRDDNIFIWEHETDNRVWKANSLEETIKKYYNNEI